MDSSTEFGEHRRMWRGAWLLLLLVAVLSLGAAKPPETSGQPQNAKAAHPAPVLVSVTDFPRHEDRGCDEGQRKRSSDLCAQWEAADAAREAAEAAQSANSVSSWALVASVVGTTFLLGSLVLAWMTSRAELRAYVNADMATLSAGIAPSPNWPQPFGLPACFIAIKNSGQTPAYRVMHWANIVFCRVLDVDCLATPPMKELHATTIPPGGVITKKLVHHSPLSPEDIVAVQRGYATFFIYGRIEYRDVFRRKRFTEYRLQHGGVWPPQGEVQLWFSELGNQSD